MIAEVILRYHDDGAVEITGYGVFLIILIVVAIWSRP